MSIDWTQPLTAAYYWAGDGSARVHSLKGFTFGIDHEAYQRAYDLDRIEWLRESFGTDLVFLSYNWGLPPEVERPDWVAFENATRAAHKTGMRVAAYIQPSNAVRTGSYVNEDWYATTPKGRRIPYYNGRFFTCLNHAGWRETVFARVRGAVAAGADAIFLDNCAFGGMPIPLANDYTGFAGCYCVTCRAQFREWQRVRGQKVTGIPKLFRPSRDPAAREYAHWRAWVLTTFLREIKEEIRLANPEAALLTNTVGAVNINTYNVFGVDLPEIAKVVDFLFVENLQSPRAKQNLLVQNAGTFKLLQSLKPGAPALSISYERGIGVDAVPASRSFARTAAEAFASGGSPVLRACEYIEDRTWTLLRPGDHDSQARAWRSIVDFTRENAELFREREPASPIAVFVPPGLAWRGDAFPTTGSDYLGTIQALVGERIPFRVVTDPSLAGDAQLLLIPDGVDASAIKGRRLLRYEDLGIRKARRSLFDYGAPWIEPAARVMGPAIINGYYSRVHVRRFVDRLDLLFRLVFKDQFEHLRIDPVPRGFLRSLLPVRVEAPTPVYVDLWKNPSGLHLHLVNYGSKPVDVRIHHDLGEPTNAAAATGSAELTGGSLRLDTYAVLSWSSIPATASRQMESALP